ncbi:hypothetical protein HPB47_027269 [Ixodes persulcatus]|uniref:Uncharacterized protein n=1 Tax=Ixodes persulcatus TaxID=34615 RepID=A0AC60PWY5_IXOPE|nr:hypothetical protein HPB47_027269 [Ixodes persulcatus]
MEETEAGEDSEFTLVQHRRQRTTGVPVLLTPVQEDKRLQQQNPLILSAEVETLAGAPIVRHRFTARGGLLLDVSEVPTVHRLLKVHSLCGIPVQATIPKAYLQNFGLIKGVPKWYTDNDLNEFLGPTGVIAARRLYQRRENATDVAQPTDRVVLTFRPNTERPDKINLGFTLHEVTEYIEAPPRCFNCQALGHIAKATLQDPLRARRSRQVVSRCFHRSSSGMLILFDLDLPNFVAASWSFNQMFLLFKKRMCNQDLIDYPHTSNITVRHRTSTGSRLDICLNTTCAELAAIWLAVQETLKHAELHHFVIFSDSQAALRQLKNLERASPLARTIAHLVQKAAVEAIQKLHSDPGTAAGTSPYTIPKKGFSRLEQALLHRIRVGCARTASRLHLIKSLTSPACSSCGATEDIEHILWHCRAVSNHRETLVTTLKQLNIPAGNTKSLLKARKLTPPLGD